MLPLFIKQHQRPSGVSESKVFKDVDLSTLTCFFFGMVILVLDISNGNAHSQNTGHSLLVVLLPYSIYSCQEWAGGLVQLCCERFFGKADSGGKKRKKKSQF